MTGAPSPAGVYRRGPTTVRLLVAVPCMAAVFGSRADAGEHLLFRSVVHLDCEHHYRISLSLHLHEIQETWEAFEVRRSIETTDGERADVHSRVETAHTFTVTELVALGETGFPLLAIPGTNLTVLYLKLLDPRNPRGALGISYPVDVRPGERKWGWLPLSIVRDGSSFGLVDGGRFPYECIEMEVNYQDYWGLKPVGFRTFHPKLPE
jgi:hypothetical protein